MVSGKKGFLQGSTIPEENSGLFSSTKTGTTYSNTLLKMLDGAIEVLAEGS
jgi:hypothetical protein